MRFFSNFFISIFLYSSVLHLSESFFSRSKSKIASKDCCLSPKINVNWNRVNLGNDFFRQLTIDADIFDDVTPENVCHLMHFLFQQASVNGKPVTVSEEMFVLFDQSNRVLNRLVQSNDTKQYPTATSESRFRHFLNRINPIRYLNRADELKTIEASDENRYPVYGMDIPESCLPNNFNRIHFGELPSIAIEQPGQRIFIKPDRVGFELGQVSATLKQVKTFVKQRFCRLVRGETKSECVKIRVFKANMDKSILRKWTKVLSKLPSKLQLNHQYRKRASQYGIMEIEQQSKDLEAAGAGRHVKNFRKLLAEKYGLEDIRLRQGREIIFSTTRLKQSHSTCESSKDKTRC